MQSEPDFSPDEYAAAFRSAPLTLPGKEVLRAHFLAKNHEASVGELAQAVGYKSRQPLNKTLQHLSQAICEELHARLSDPVMILASVDQAPGTEPRLTLRPAVVEALETLRWFESA